MCYSCVIVHFGYDNIFDLDNGSVMTKVAGVGHEACQLALLWISAIRPQLSLLCCLAHFLFPVFFPIVSLTATVPKVSNPLHLFKFRSLFLSVSCQRAPITSTSLGNEVFSKLWFLYPPGLGFFLSSYSHPPWSPSSKGSHTVLFGPHCLSNNKPASESNRVR